jgi:holliday junction DNA helicase RuvA
MIRRMRGELVETKQDAVLLAIGDIWYEISVSTPVRDRIAERGLGTQVDLHIYHYLTIEQSRSVPFLLGFETETQREFFERLLDVPRIGPMAALRMMVLPVSTIAVAIETQDTRVLESLPGVGKQKARDLIATLQGKVGRFVDAKELSAETPATRPLSDVEADALAVLTQLGFSRQDGLRSINSVLADDAKIANPEEIVRRVFAARE